MLILYSLPVALFSATFRWGKPTESSAKDYQGQDQAPNVSVKWCSLPVERGNLLLPYLQQLHVGLVNNVLDHDRYALITITGNIACFEGCFPTRFWSQKEGRQKPVSYLREVFLEVINAGNWDTLVIFEIGGTTFQILSCILILLTIATVRHWQAENFGFLTLFLSYFSVVAEGCKQTGWKRARRKWSDKRPQMVQVYQLEEVGGSGNSTKFSSRSCWKTMRCELWGVLDEHACYRFSRC